MNITFFAGCGIIIGLAMIHPGLGIIAGCIWVICAENHDDNNWPTPP